MRTNELLNELLEYGIKKEILDKVNYNYTANVLIDLFKINYFIKTDTSNLSLDNILEELALIAYRNNIIDSDDVTTMDNFKAKLIDLLIDKPKEVISKFYNIYETSPENATNYLYQLATNTNYVQTKRIAQNITWESKTDFGSVILTINLSKPEKDPRLIAKQLTEQSHKYPKCHLCVENEGYRGHISHDARSNLRIIPIKLNNEEWYFQYSPYSYFNEHSIVLNKEHIPMKIDYSTFIKLFDFIDMFPHYFIGSNAGLPIVGGSILNHEHYQAGQYNFPIEKAKELLVMEKDTVSMYVLNWPLSTVRLKSKNRDNILIAANKILDSWNSYENKELLIINNKEHIHNTITPILRKENSYYVFDLVLRNNYTNNQFPDGLFHVHPKYYNIKKENIGLIEAMGMGVLPPRLKNEFNLIKKILLEEISLETANIPIHNEWIRELLKKYNKNNCVDEFIKNEAAIAFGKALECAGVFKSNEKGRTAFLKFVKTAIN